MIERQSGSIVLTSSINGLEPGKDDAHYVAAEHGVIGLMKNDVPAARGHRQHRAVPQLGACRGGHRRHDPGRRRPHAAHGGEPGPGPVTARPAAAAHP
jgi:hypothetical protein